MPSAKAAWYGTARRAGSVSRSVFWPVPGVDSALVAIDLHPHPRTDDRAAVFAVIDAAFAQRRKTLRVRAGRLGGLGGVRRGRADQGRHRSDRPR